MVPESVLWLVSKEKFETARKLILRASKKNGKSVPECLLVTPSVPNNNIEVVKIDNYHYHYTQQYYYSTISSLMECEKNQSSTKTNHLIQKRMKGSGKI